MKIKMLNKTDREIKFLFEDSNPQFANALRRIMISEVPILSVEKVDFTANDSVLYNEIIAHRLGLIPLVFNPKDFKFKEEDEEGSASNEVVFVINKKGPCMVYTKDIKSSNPDVKPLYDDMPIVELFDDQKIKLEAHASLGLGKNHARNQGAIASYKYLATISLNGKIENSDECVRKCPKHALKIDGNKVSIDNNCDLCKECMKVCSPAGSLEIKEDSTKFIFNVESVSGLNAGDLVLQAVDILKSKVKDFEKEAKKIK